MTIPHIKSVGRSPLRLGFIFISMVFVCFGLSPAMRAVDPPPDGGYPNGNTAEGDDALFSLTTARFNTTNGVQALFTATTGGKNTATSAPQQTFSFKF